MNRGKSLLGSHFEAHENLITQQNIESNYSPIISRLKQGPKLLKQHLRAYRQATTNASQLAAYQQFRRQQNSYKSYRNQLKRQLDITPVTSSSQISYIRSQLIIAIRQEMNIQLEMNHCVQRKKQDQENVVNGLQIRQGRTVRVQNALDDILQKQREIQQLAKSVEQCLQLFKIIGILLQQNAPKLDQLEENVRKCNQYIERAEMKIDKAKERQKRSTRKKCCVILFGLIAIILILAVLYGFNLFQNI